MNRSGEGQVFNSQFGKSSNFKISSFRPDEDHRPACEPIRIDVCKDMAYNLTMMPNIFKHQTQKDAQEEVSTFSSLITFNCSPYLKIFICTLYAPICTDLDSILTPCRSLCEEVRQSCEKNMNLFNYQWPPSWNCAQFNKPTCVGENKTQLLKDLDKRQPNTKIKNNGHTNALDRNGDKKLMPLQCLPKMKVPKNYQYSIKISNNKIKDCGMPCSFDGDSFFDASKKAFAWYMVGTASIICLISTLFTLITFLVDMDRFPYPERPIIFLSGCYLAVSISFIIGFATGNNVACVGPFSSEESSLDYAQASKVVIQGKDKELCTVVFVILYYFSMASCLWWVILTITWFLSASLKWGQEALNKNSHYFHLIAWSLPAVQVIAILALDKIEGDNLVGVCYVGVYDEKALVIFVIVPLVVYLLVGIFFLMAGLFSLFKIRTAMKQEGFGTEKLEKLMLRIGVFSLLYTVPAGVVVACHIYELTLRSDWLMAWYTKTCYKYNYLSCPVLSFRKQYDGDAKNSPDFTIFMIKYMMMLLVGICSGFWVWSGKTFLSIRRKLCCCCSSVFGEADDDDVKKNSPPNVPPCRNNFYTGVNGGNEQFQQSHGTGVGGGGSKV
ncbi:hypothetical protein HELRODRAFT_63277 [Helobdella robusta]|uniref:Uncharacterized protein n=1 Tax=Helobdella robusta TaxID=6412 RepID=T1FXD5_HELRO|nr:hypothetical protein HELRODRAFT_63277 [Helobdella robusta]ESO13179.1 hypothetical protein HELRODRAFT_63277 [Helobdella robusta]